ncbi:ArsR/SmtB family transcription factor [Pseudotabrizicola alkalilacus]|uniref:ArsR family transcriptional regulator n=1 Tax=Pseudotabrizicola alkalilacus TaxID=2305252 RepID=A0A411YZT0_9RHOB|nr:metalloregulator ArsR/SmtB family transcription factor [Pseudotabrizicola alkalilacus]RGP36315.1 ArsR family transcriptional regulator [Pseudotabrizicola alkalilacus]
MAAGSEPGRKNDAESVVTVLKVLSHTGRLQILCLLLDGRMNVGALSAVLGEPQAAVSQQLMRLRSEGFVRASRHGKTMLYEIADPRVLPVIQALRSSYCGDDADALFR